MSANADDLRLFYGPELGESVLVSASTTPSSTVLGKGRYLVRYRSVSGAAVIWARQGASASDLASTAAPSTPHDVSAFDKLGGQLFVTHVLGGDSAKSQLSFVTDAGTAQIVITRIARA